MLKTFGAPQKCTATQPAAVYTRVHLRGRITRDYLSERPLLSNNLLVLTSIWCVIHEKKRDSYFVRGGHNWYFIAQLVLPFGLLRMSRCWFVYYNFNLDKYKPWSLSWSISCHRLLYTWKWEVVTMHGSWLTCVTWLQHKLLMKNMDIVIYLMTTHHELIDD